jgi:FKBP12-rapamycin complex-associated protein
LKSFRAKIILKCIELVFENCFKNCFKNCLKVHSANYSRAQSLIDKARKLIDTELTTMAGESYNRAYAAMVQIQMMSELEEVIQYKLVPERREMIKQKWWQRLQGCQRVVEDWQKILQVHSLVLQPHEDMRSWLKFAKLCQRNGRLQLSYRTLVTLLDTDPSNLGSNKLFIYLIKSIF